MNVLILSDVFTYSGVGNYMKFISSELYRGNHLVVMASSNVLRRDVDKGIKIIQIAEAKHVWWFIKDIRKIIVNYNIDVIHVNHRRPAANVLLYRLIFGKIPTVWTCHTVPYPNNIIKRLLGFYGDVSIAISSEAYKWMHEELKIKNNRLQLIRNGVDEKELICSNIVQKRAAKKQVLNQYWSIKDNMDDYIVIACHGRISKEKGLDILIDALSKLANSYLSRIRVLCSGEQSGDYYDALTESISHKGLSENIRFVGWTKTNDILSACDLMVQPSRREGFPLSSVEAFFMKTPVIRTKTGGYEDMKEFCIGIDIDNTVQLCDELKNFIESPDHYSSMVENAYQWACDNCTIEIMTQKTLNAYEKAINC